MHFLFVLRHSRNKWMCHTVRYYSNFIVIKWHKNIENKKNEMYERCEYITGFGIHKRDNKEIRTLDLAVSLQQRTQTLTFTSRISQVNFHRNFELRTSIYNEADGEKVRRKVFRSDRILHKSEKFCECEPIYSIRSCGERNGWKVRYLIMISWELYNSVFMHTLFFCCGCAATALAHAALPHKKMSLRFCRKTKTKNKDAPWYNSILKLY